MALLTTLLLLAAAFLLTGLLGINFVLLLVVGTAFWAAYDSARIELSKYESGISHGPAVVFFVFIMLWIAAFPWYLSVRYKITHGLAQRKEPTLQPELPRA